jgi:hypothetical protein
MYVHIYIYIECLYIYIYIYKSRYEYCIDFDIDADLDRRCAEIAEDVLHVQDSVTCVERDNPKVSIVFRSPRSALSTLRLLKHRTDSLCIPTHSTSISGIACRTSDILYL